MSKYKFSWKDLSLNDFKVYFFFGDKGLEESEEIYFKIVPRQIFPGQFIL